MEEVAQALIQRYSKEGTHPPNVDASEVSAYLQQISELPNPGTLTGLIRLNQPQWQLDELSLAILSSVDDCTTMIFRITQMAPEVDHQFRRVLPVLAATLLQTPSLPLTKDPVFLMILDVLNQGMVGWTEGLGAGSNKLQATFENAIDQLLMPETDLDALYAEVLAFMTKESDKIRRLEERLTALETGLVRSKQAKVLAANLINKSAHEKLVTESLANFLRGPWYDSLQLLANEKGVESEEWQRAEALTATLVWTYQPIESDAKDTAKEKQRLYNLIEHLPAEVRELLVALAHNTAGVDTALDSLEVDHANIVSGLTPEFIEFELIESEASASQSTVSRVLLRKVTGLKTGQWFSHTEGDKIQLIKLVMKLDDVNQLLFTNRNGMKVMQKSFDEFAYDLSSRAVSSINPDAAFSSTICTYYQGLVDELHKHRKLIAERKSEVDRLDEDRKKAQQKAQQEAKKLRLDKEDAERSRLQALKASTLASARAEAEKSENSDLVAEFTTVVASLSTGAVVHLPNALGEKQECTLAVRITAANKLIFVDRNGMKAGDYQCQQLVELLVAGKAELGDQSVEIEDTLAAVVTKLRSDREKSYDDLTGT